MTHPIFALVFDNNLIEVTALIQSDPGAVIEIDSEWNDATPLHRASIEGHLQICRVLLQHDAPVDSLDNTGETPLHYASQEGHHEVGRPVSYTHLTLPTICSV